MTLARAPRPTVDLTAPYGAWSTVVEAELATVQALAERRGECSITLAELGRSFAGRPIVAVSCRASRHDDAGEEPLAERGRVLVVANLHGVEHIGVHVALGLLRRLAEGEAARLLALADVVVVPSANPDGYDATVEGSGRGPLAVLRCNARGVDLNRNFPRPGDAPPSWLPFTGSSRPGRATYRGPQPLSEPESAAIASLLSRERFSVVFSLHSFMGRLILPCTRSRADHEGYREITGAFRSGQSIARYPTLANRRFDVFTGELEDHVHHVHDAWALCVEIFPIVASLRQHLTAPSPFWRFNPRDVAKWVDNDVPGILAAAEAAVRMGPPSRRREAGATTDTAG